MVESWQFADEGLLPADFLISLSVQERAESLRKVIELNETSDLRDTRLVYEKADPESFLGGLLIWSR